MITGISGVINAQANMRVVAEASDDDQALKLFRKFRPDITLIDIWFPKMDGIENWATNSSAKHR